MNESARLEIDPRSASIRTPEASASGWSTRRRVSWLAALALIVGLGSSPAPASAEEYNAQEAGYPVRIVAYALHPIGVVLDYTIMRPAFWVGSHEPFRTLFGRTD